MDIIASVLECFSSDAILPVKNYLRVLLFRKRAANLPVLFQEIKRMINKVVGKWGYGSRPQVSRYMPRMGLKCVARCCLSILRLGHG